MLTFKEEEIKEKDCTLKNYRGVRVDYEGKPMFFVVTFNLNALVMINESGDFTSIPLNSTVYWGDLWENILRNKYFYDDCEDSWDITDYFESFDIAITKKL